MTWDQIEWTAINWEPFWKGFAGAVCAVFVIFMGWIAAEAIRDIVEAKIDRAWRAGYAKAEAELDEARFATGRRGNASNKKSA